MIFTKILQKMLKPDLILDNELDRLLPIGKKNVIVLSKDGLGGKIMIKLDRLRVKTYSYLIGHGSEDPKSKRYKKVCHKREN